MKMREMQLCSYSHNFGKNNGSSKSIRIYHNSQGDGTMLYLREDIPSKHLAVEMSPGESLCVLITVVWVVSMIYMVLKPYN